MGLNDAIQQRTQALMATSADIGSDVLLLLPRHFQPFWTSSDSDLEHLGCFWGSFIL